jgi:hypothetical protein
MIFQTIPAAQWVGECFWGGKEVAVIERILYRYLTTVDIVTIKQSDFNLRLTGEKGNG